MSAVRKKTTRSRKTTKKKEPFYKTAEGIGKAVIVVAGALGILWAILTGGLRIHDGAEIAHRIEPVVVEHEEDEIPALFADGAVQRQRLSKAEQTLSIIAGRAARLEQKSEFTAEACAAGRYKLEDCKGYPHPGDKAAK